MFRTKHGYTNVTCMRIYICLFRSLKNPIPTHIYKLALKFTFNLFECPILCSFEVLILIVMFFYKHVHVMHTSIFKNPASKLIIYAQILLANASILN